jgi:hypothetical protein
MDEQSYKMLKKLKKFLSDMSIFLNQEIEFFENEKVSGKDNLNVNGNDNENNGDKNGDDIRDELAEKWAESLSILDPAFCTSSSSFDSSHLLTTESYHIHPAHIVKVSDALSSKEPTHFENKNEIIRIPVGESVTVRAEFRNKLSTKINLTDLRLEITPSNDFTVTPYSATVSSNSRVDVLVQSMAVRTGLYKVRAQNPHRQCYHLNEESFFSLILIERVSDSEKICTPLLR